MLTINLNDDAFLINQQEFVFPITTEKLILLLGSSHRTIQSEASATLVWDELGITAYAPHNNLIDTIEIYFQPEDYQQSPQQPFIGKFEYKNQDAISYFFEHPELRVPIYEGDAHKALVAHNISAWFHGNFKQHQVDGISFSHYEAPPTPKALSLAPQFEHLEKLWTEWIYAIEQIVPKHNEYYNLKHGIGTQEIQDTQAYNDMQMPEILLNFYKIHNVYWDAVTSVFQFNVNGWGYDLLPFEKIYDEWEGITQLNTEEAFPSSTYPNYDSRTKINDYTNLNWIPFAESREGDYLLIDLDPNEQGKYGQIIELQNESWERNVIANSLEDLIQITIQQLNDPEDDRYEFILENG